MKLICRTIRRAQLIARTLTRQPLPPEAVTGERELRRIYTDALGPNAQVVLLEIARRLAKGAIDHGDMKPRPWTTELREELTDGLVYLTIDTLSAEGRLRK